MPIAYDDTNIFAKILRGEIPSIKLHEDDDCLVIMDVMPQADGHCLVIPKSPSRNLLDADPAALSKVILVVQRMANAVKEAFDADGIRIMQFNEGAAGQTVFHLHFHVIPAHDGVPMRAHSGKMEDFGILNANADKIREALAP